MANLSDDLSPTQALAVLLGAAIYAGAQWIRHRLTHKPAHPSQAEAWAEGFKAGVQASATGYPVANPYVGEPVAFPKVGTDRQG